MTLCQEAVVGFELPSLPYPFEALEPHISRRTMEFHYDKHHRGYVSKLNELVRGTPYDGTTLEGVVRKTGHSREHLALFNNAAQAWNHNFFWRCMTPGGGGAPKGNLASRLRESFGGYDGFRQKFVRTAVAQFGSGWTWLVMEDDHLDIVSTSNADNPLVNGRTPLLTCDVWEHAYYLDYQNRRQDFVEKFLDYLVNWDYASDRLARAPTTEELFEEG
jgi:Fe-Mn family superoxide dismutase